MSGYQDIRGLAEDQNPDMTSTLVYITCGAKHALRKAIRGLVGEAELEGGRKGRDAKVMFLRGEGGQ